MANSSMITPEKAPMAQGMLPAPQTIHVQPNQQVTIIPPSGITIVISPSQQPASTALDRPESENQPSGLGTQHLALENSSPTQVFATRTPRSAPRERVVWRKFQQYIQPRPFEDDCRFETLHGNPASITFRTLYDTGCEVNLISETNVNELGYRNKIRKPGNFVLVSLANTKIECLGEVDLPWTSRKGLFRSKTERVTFVVVPSSNTAITGPIIGADTLNTFGLLQTKRREWRAFGAVFRRFESNPTVSDQAAANRLLYAQIKVENKRQLKGETPQPIENDKSQQTENLPPQQNVGKP